MKIQADHLTAVSVGNRGVENVAEKPKITGLSFNLFAIMAVLILLPLGTSIVSSLSASTSSEYQSVNQRVEPDEGFYPNGQTRPPSDTYMMSWIDKGNNVTDQYLLSNPSSSVDDYETIFPDYLNECYYNWVWFCNEHMNSGINLNYRFARNNDVFFQSWDNHHSLRQSGISGYDGYIGYSGNEYSWQVHKDYMKYIPNSSDISKLKFTFVDFNNAYSCDVPIWQELKYKSDIKFRYDDDPLNTYSLNGFDLSESNKYKVDYLPAGQTTNYLNGTSQPIGEICHVQFVLEYELSPFEVLEFAEKFNREYNKLDLFIRVYDIQAKYNEEALQEGGMIYSNTFMSDVSYPLAFEGDWKHGILFEYAESDTSKTNFFLSGGTLIMGALLFLLAISSTQYYNPVINFFKPKGA